jgi:hypothetical protein
MKKSNKSFREQLNARILHKWAVSSSRKDGSFTVVFLTGTAHDSFGWIYEGYSIYIQKGTNNDFIKKIIKVDEVLAYSEFKDKKIADELKIKLAKFILSEGKK